MAKVKEHKVKSYIIKKLANGEFHSGEDLGAELNISRAAIGKHIKGIQTWGLDIERVQGKGYRFSQAIDLLDYDYIQSKLTTAVTLIPVIDSTNQYLLDQGRDLESGSVCISEYQAKGRGRRGRQWISPYGTNLYFSMYWRLESGVAAAMGLSLAIGVAIIDALETLGINDLKLKWPNDIYYKDTKLAGILVEMSGQTGEAAHIVIGMGLNVKMSGEQAGIDQAWTTLEQAILQSDTRSDAPEKISCPSRSDLAVALISAWADVLVQYEDKGLSDFIERWNELDNFRDKPIKLVMGNREVEGIGKGINEQGAVMIETAHGLEAFVGGEISLRKA